VGLVALLEARQIRIPGARQHLQARHVDLPVVQPAFEARHVAGEEGAVGVDRVAGEDALAERAMLRHQRERVALGVRQRDLRRADAIEQARARVHVAHERLHAREHLGGLPDHALELGDRREVAARQHDAYLDDRAAVEIEAGHLEVEPDEEGVLGLRHGSPN